VLADGLTDGSPFFSTSGTPAVLLLNPDGEVAAEVEVTSSLLGVPADESVSLSTVTRSLAIDPSGDIILGYSRTSSGSVLSDVFVRLSPSGEVTGEFFLGEATEGASLENEIAFDSEGRLVVVGQDISRFDFV